MSPQAQLRCLTAFRRDTHITFVALSIALNFSLGCKAKSATDDVALTSAVSTEIGGDPSLSGQQIQTSVQQGIVTLSGGVLNDAQRTIAARDAAGVRGVKEVVNTITLSSASATSVPSHSLGKSRPSSPVLSTRNQPQPTETSSSSSAAPIQRSEAPQTGQFADNPQPPTRPSPPSLRIVSVPIGTTLPIRVTQTLDSASTQPGDNFSGVIASDVVVDGVVAIPAGSAVTGNVDAVQEAAHFKGNSLLTVSLTGLKDRGDRIPLSTDPYTVTGKGRGKNTAEKAGGGAAVGAILGGIFGGGKGAAIGAAAGGGAGAGVNAVTRGQQVQILSETIVHFHTASSINVRVRADAAPDANSDPDLQRHPN